MSLRLRPKWKPAAAVALAALATVLVVGLPWSEARTGLERGPSGSAPAAEAPFGGQESGLGAGGPPLAVTDDLERCVTRGLDYLAKTQDADGSWANSQGAEGGVAGLAIMAFLAHGELPGEGRYGQALSRAIDYLIKTQDSNGLLAGRNSGSPMYSHGFATLALAEAYGLVDDPRLGPAVKKAVGLIVSGQNRQGGWRYSVGCSDSDTTVSGAQMVALRAAASAGIEVPSETIRRGVAYYKSCFCPGGGFGYTGPDGPDRCRAGIGLLVLALSGEYRAAETKATADYLYNDAMDTGYFYYMCYYCSQASFQAGGKYWQSWNETMTPALIGRQQADGSFPGGSDSGGEVAGTAMALLSVEVNYGLLPIYQR